MYKTSELSSAPSSVLYGNGFQSFKQMERSAPLNSLADNFALISERRSMLARATQNQRNELGSKMMSGGGKNYQQGESQLAQVQQPRGTKSILTEDEYSKLGGMMANFFAPQPVGIVQQVVQAAAAPGGRVRGQGMPAGAMGPLAGGLQQ